MNIRHCSPYFCHHNFNFTQSTHLRIILRLCLYRMKAEFPYRTIHYQLYNLNIHLSKLDFHHHMLIFREQNSHLHILEYIHLEELCNTRGILYIHSYSSTICNHSDKVDMLVSYLYKSLCYRLKHQIFSKIHVNFCNIPIHKDKFVALHYKQNSNSIAHIFH